MEQKNKMTNLDRIEYNSALNVIKRLILNGFSDDNFAFIQEQMLNIQPYTVPNDYRKLGELVRDSYTDDCDIKELNQLIRMMKLDESK